MELLEATNTYHKLHTGSGWSLEIMQTIFLCELYARFRGRERSSYQPSDLFKALYESVSVLSRRPTAVLQYLAQGICCLTLRIEASFLDVE
jgi:hypothetical protein